MSATDIGKELGQLSEVQRKRAAELKARIEALEAELHRLLNQAGSSSSVVDLCARGIDESHARDLRTRLKTFAEDWDRPEAAIYDEDPAR